MNRADYWRRRALIAEREIEFEKRHNENTRAWAHAAFDEQRRLSDRCTFLYGVAIRHGATDDELRGES